MPDPKSREQQLEERYRVERLEIMKTLSALCHKINNPLTTLLGRAHMLKHLGKDLEVARAADAIERSSQRIAGYIGELAEVVKEGREESLDRLLDTGRGDG